MCSSDLLAVGCLRKVITKIKSVNDVTSVSFSGGSGISLLSFSITASEVEYSGYYIESHGGYITCAAAQNGTFELDDITTEQVTDCAATGFHIISAQGGSTQNWQNVSGPFCYNDSAGYSWKLYKVR